MSPLKNSSKQAKIAFASSALVVFFWIAVLFSPGDNSQVDQTTQSVNESSTVQIDTVQIEPIKDVITTKEETETKTIKYSSKTQEDSSLEEGSSYVKVNGVNGEKKIIHIITYTNGTETDRETSEKITKQPVDEITVVGTKVKPVSNCDPNYTGCVPVASDVDCGGGSGNGPAYQYEVVQVIGYDKYGLDRDNDGWACE